MQSFSGPFLESNRSFTKFIIFQCNIKYLKTNTFDRACVKKFMDKF